MNEIQMREVAKTMLEDQNSPILKAELRHEADGTPYFVILQDQGIAGTKKFGFSMGMLERKAEFLIAEEKAKEAALKTGKETAKAGKKAGKKVESTGETEAEKKVESTGDNQAEIGEESKAPDEEG